MALLCPHLPSTQLTQFGVTSTGSSTSQAQRRLMKPEQRSLDSHLGSLTCCMTLGNHLPLFGYQLNHLSQRAGGWPLLAPPSLPHPRALVQTLTESSGRPFHRHSGFSKIAAFFPKVPSHPRMQPRKGSRQRSHLWLPDPASKANKPVCLPLSLRSPWWEKPNPDSGGFCGPRSKPVQGHGLPEIAELLAAWVHLLGWCWGYLKG